MILTSDVNSDVNKHTSLNQGQDRGLDCQGQGQEQGLDPQCQGQEQGLDPQGQGHEQGLKFCP